MNLFEIYKSSKYGYYEKRLCLLLLIATISNPFPAMQTLITLYSPTHHCHVQDIIEEATKQAAVVREPTASNWSKEILNLTIPWEVDNAGVYHRSTCKQYYNISSRLLLNHQHNVSSKNEMSFVSKIPCKSFEFESNAISAVTEWGLVCDKSWMIPLLTLMLMVGLGVGGILGGYVSDRIGRRTAFLVFTFWQFAVSFCTSFVSSPTALGVMMFLAGTGGLANYMAGSLIGAEFLHPNLRFISYFGIGLGYSFGYMLLGPIMYLFQNWRWYLRFTGLIGILYIPYFWLIDETPVWLAATGKQEECDRVLNKIAKMNKQAVQSKTEFEEMLQEKLSLRSSGFSKTFLEVIKNWRMFSRLAFAVFSWCIVSLSYYAIALNANNLSGNRFVNVFYGGLTELGSAFIFILFVETRGRRNCYMMTMGLSGLAIAVTPFLAALNGTLAVAITMFSKLMVGTAFMIIYIYTGEMFPTTTRQFIIGICAVFARIGGIISPYIIHAGENGDTLPASLGVAAAIFLSVALYLFLPETKSKMLPQTLDEALKMQGLIKLNCCQSRNNECNKRHSNDTKI